MARTDYRHPGVYNSSDFTLATGEGSALTTDANGRVEIGAIIPGTAATRLGKAEDAAHTSGDVGVFMLAVRQDTPATTSADGDYTQLNVESTKGLRVTQGSLISGEDQTYNVIKTQTRGTYTVPLTASALVFSGPGQLMGFIVNSCAAGATLKIWDNTSAATTVVCDTMTFTAAVAQGPVVVTFPAAVQLAVGCYFTIAVAAMSVTPIWNQA